MFQELMRSMGTERHQKFIEKCDNYEISGCFCMTEMSHGSNTRELKTVAHYDPKTEVNLINLYDDHNMVYIFLGICYQYTEH